MIIEYSNNLPIYLQLAEDLKIQIISNKLKVGERLASVRDLALMYKVNPNTMQKALVELENLKLVITERTNGKYIIGDQKIIENIRENYANQICFQFIENMEKVGYNHEDCIKLLRNFKKEE